MMEVPNKARDSGLNPNDTFESSPFDSPQVCLALADGCRLTIHRSILQRCAKLGREINSAPEAVQVIELRRFSGTAGHALVEYLYTSRYRLLKWTGAASVDLGLSTLAAMFETYALARTLELDGLERQVRYDIECAASHLDIIAVIDVVKDVYPTPIGNDRWFTQWIKDVTKKAFKHPERLMRITTRPDFRDDASLAKFLFKSMLESYIDVLKSVVGHDAASISTGAVAAEADKTPTSGSSLVDIGGSGVRDTFQGAIEAIPEPAPEPAPAPAPEPAPEPHPVPSLEEEHAPEPTPELAESGPSMPEDELSANTYWGGLSAGKIKKMKRDKKKALKAASAEAEPQAAPETEQVPEPPSPESEPTPEQVHETPPAGLSEGNGNADFDGGLRALHQEDGEYTYAVPRNPYDTLGTTYKSKKKKKKARQEGSSPLPEPGAEVIKAVEIVDERRGHPEPSAMEADDTTEASRDVWGFWGVPKERRSPRASIGY